MENTVSPIAFVQSDFPTKFGIPRQSGLVPSLSARIVFEKPYRDPDAVKGLEDFSHLWLIWGFSAVKPEPFRPMVRPPRLGGNERVGVFATRSPFRPNRLGLSSVRILSVEPKTPEGPVITVGGADLMDGTPVYDIKPYIPSDCHPDAKCGFAESVAWKPLRVVLPPDLEALVPPEKRDALLAVLREDPRPAYERGEAKEFGLAFAGMDVRFRAEGSVLTVTGIRDSGPSGGGRGTPTRP